MLLGIAVQIELHATLFVFIKSIAFVPFKSLDLSWIILAFKLASQMKIQLLKY